MKKGTVNALLGCTEQFTNRYNPGGELSEDIIDVMLLINERKPGLGLSYYVACILARGGCRVSEVLNITYKDIVSCDTVYIRGLKHSRDKMVVIPECVVLFTKCITFHCDPFPMLTRRVVWSNFKKCGLYIKSDVKSNSKVTHMFRHLVADNVRCVSTKKYSVRDVLGHNSNLSQEYYGKKK